MCTYLRHRLYWKLSFHDDGLQHLFTSRSAHRCAPYYPCKRTRPATPETQGQGGQRSGSTDSSVKFIARRRSNVGPTNLQTAAAGGEITTRHHPLTSCSIAPRHCEFSSVGSIYYLQLTYNFRTNKLCYSNLLPFLALKHFSNHNSTSPRQAVSAVLSLSQPVSSCISVKSSQWQPALSSDLAYRRDISCT